MRIQLSEHFTYRKLLRFVFPSIAMMIFTSLYGVVDGLFVSNMVGKTPFAALNLIWPYIMILGCSGFMIAAGGSALVAKTMGEGDDARANRMFSLLTWFTVGLGVALGVIGLLTVRPVSILLGAGGEMLEYSVLYGSILLIALPMFMVQGAFQTFFITAEKPTLGLIVTVAAGCANMVLDFLFIAVFEWGLAGAALATAASQTVGGIFPLIYFARPNDSRLRFCRTKWEGWVILKTLTNGCSELVTNVSASLVSMLYNAQLLHLRGEDGIAAYGVLMYINFVFIAIFLGYVMGMGPIVSYHYGAGNTNELKNMRRKSLFLVILAGVSMNVLAVTLSSPFSQVFVGYDAELFALTRRGFILFGFSFLPAGFNIFGSAFFTSLGNGPVSAIISFLRTFVFQIAAVLLLPLWLNVDGIWLSAVAAEGVAMTVTVVFLLTKRKKYQY